MSPPASTTTPLRLAILDDYQSIGAPKFTHLTSAPHNLSISSYPQTLDPRNPTQRSELITRLQPYTIISAMRERTPLPAEVIDALPNLRLIMTTGNRNAAIDLDACTRRGVVVTGTGGYTPPPKNKSDEDEDTDADAVPPPPHAPNATTVHTWALILALARHLPRDHAAITAGNWQGTTLATGLAGKTLSVLGFGRLGAEVARIGYLAFGMRVLAWSASLTQEGADARGAQLGMPAGAVRVVASKEELVRKADVLSLHYVLSARSRGIIGEGELRGMKSSAVLVNTSRGPLVDEGALLDCLKRGEIAGAGLDVFKTEPLPKDSEWRGVRWGVEGRSEVVLSPHMGYGEEGTMNAWYEEQAGILERWMGGEEVGPRLN